MAHRRATGRCARPAPLANARGRVGERAELCGDGVAGEPDRRRLVWFHDTSTAALSDRDDRGRRYRATLAAYWPWGDGEIVGKAEGTRLLYDCVRNPLAHAFGMPGLDDEGTPIAILEDPLTAERIAELDLAETRPQGLGPTIRPARSGAPERAYFLAVRALYWGVQRLLRAVLTDEHQLPAAEELAHALERFLSKPT